MAELGLHSLPGSSRQFLTVYYGGAKWARRMRRRSVEHTTKREEKSIGTESTDLASTTSRVKSQSMLKDGVLRTELKTSTKRDTSLTSILNSRELRLLEVRLTRAAKRRVAYKIAMTLFSEE